jgi:hypothetical protein
VPVVTEPLTLPIGCWTSPDPDATGVLHEVTLHPDGTVEVPHELQAERLAAAFGGYLSCLELVDRVAPALDRWWQLQRRRLLPPLSRGPRGQWRPLPAASGPCCSSAPQVSPVAEHVRSTEHLTRAGRLPARLVQPLSAALLAVHGVPRLPQQAALDAVGCVRGVDGVTMLWEAGLHPAVVRTVHDRLVGPRGPELPQALYLGSVSRRPDLAWVADTLRRVAEAAGGSLPQDQEEELAEWLTWTQSRLDPRERQRRAEWLTVGVPRGWVVELVRSGYGPEHARLLAAGTRRSVPGAVSLLRSWSAAGLRPRVEDLLALHAAGLPVWSRPSRGAVDRVLGLVGDLQPRPDATTAALALVREGTVPAAAGALRAAASTPNPRQECA